MRTPSPYLNSSNRLADVIAAIQAMATYTRYKLTFEEWADRLSADKTRGSYWKAVFEEHSEFFRLDSTKTRASLVWRRQYPKRFDTQLDRVLSTPEYRALSPSDQERIQRVTLAPADIKTLIDTAINLHSRAIAERAERRWWLPVLTSGIAALIGASIGVLLGK
jgi:hypothetical protein